MAQLMPLSLTVSCFSKIQIGFTFLVPAHLGSPGKRAVKRLCVCVSVLDDAAITRMRVLFSARVCRRWSATAVCWKRVWRRAATSAGRCASTSTSSPTCWAASAARHTRTSHGTSTASLSSSSRRSWCSPNSSTNCRTPPPNNKVPVLTVLKKVKVAHARLPSVGFRS